MARVNGIGGAKGSDLSKFEGTVRDELNLKMIGVLGVLFLVSWCSWFSVCSVLHGVGTYIHTIVQYSSRRISSGDGARF